MRIGRSDLVLEIGSGHNPRPRSDVLCDNSIDADTERGGRIVRDRPIVEADAQALPFRDSSFDYVICSHVLEHVEDPERMLRELMRVASAGYIETPSEIGKLLYGWPFHRSVVRSDGTKLVIRKKDFVSPFGELFHVIGARDPGFRRFHLTHGRLFLVQYEWRGRIEYEISTGRPVDLHSAPVVEELWSRAADTSRRDRWVALAKNLVPTSLTAWGKSVVARTMPRRQCHLRDVVACPVCKGSVDWVDAWIECSRCRVRYPIVDGIPRFLAGSA